MARRPRTVPVALPADAPAATRELGSPNACNVCHADRDAGWAEKTIRGWGEKGRWSERILREGRPIESGRWVAGFEELMHEVGQAKGRASRGDLIEVLDDDGRRLELFRS